jgi:hypothetical protein
LQALLEERVRYVIVHGGLYRPGGADGVISALRQHPGFRELGRFRDGVGDAVVFSPR